MLAFLKGTIRYIDQNSLILETHTWEGYEVLINPRIFATLGSKTSGELYIYHHITENNQALFWFLSYEERVFFKELIKISGVWWKLAQNILSIWVPQIIQSIQTQDTNVLLSIKWVGKKIIEKIILEFQDKDLIKNHISLSNTQTSQAHSFNSPLQNEITLSLVALWYSEKKVWEVFRTLPKDLLSVEEILPYMLKNM